MKWKMYALALLYVYFNDWVIPSHLFTSCHKFIWWVVNKRLFNLKALLHIRNHMFDKISCKLAQRASDTFFSQYKTQPSISPKIWLFTTQNDHFQFLRKFTTRCTFFEILHGKKYWKSQTKKWLEVSKILNKISYLYFFIHLCLLTVFCCLQ